MPCSRAQYTVHSFFKVTLATSLGHGTNFWHTTPIMTMPRTWQLGNGYSPHCCMSGPWSLPALHTNRPSSGNFEVSQEHYHTPTPLGASEEELPLSVLAFWWWKHDCVATKAAGPLTIHSRLCETKNLWPRLMCTINRHVGGLYMVWHFPLY